MFISILLMFSFTLIPVFLGGIITFIYGIRTLPKFLLPLIGFLLSVASCSVILPEVYIHTILYNALVVVFSMSIWLTIGIIIGITLRHFILR